MTGAFREGFGAHVVRGFWLVIVTGVTYAYSMDVVRCG